MEGGWCPADGAETAVQEATRGLAGGSRGQPPTRAHQAAGARWRWEAPGRGEVGGGTVCSARPPELCR